MPIRPTKKGRALIRTKKFRKWKKSPLSAKVLNKLKIITTQIEKKFVDIPIDDTFGSDANVQKLCVMTEGNTSSQRNGLKIYAKSLHFRYRLAWSNTAGQETTCRMIIFIDKNSSGSLPTGSDLLESGTSNSSHYNNINEGKRFVVLKDVYFNNRDPSPSGGVVKEQCGYIRIPINRVMTYLSSNADNASLGTNMLYVLFVGDALSASSNAPAINLQSRVYYTDL